MALEVGGVFASLGAKLDDSGFDRFDRRIDAAERRAKKPVEARAEANTRDAEQGLRRFERKLDDTERHSHRFRSGVVGTFGALRVGVAGAAAAGGAAVGLLGKAVIGTATDINESLSKNKVLFGEHAASVDAFSKRSATSFGISRTAALEATGTFGNLFTALELGPKKSADMSVGLTKLAADMASFNNASPEEALEAIRSGLVGETEPLRKFGVNLNDAALRQEALHQGLVKTTKEALTPQQKALAVNALLFKQTEKAQGDFSRTSGGLANQQRILRARLSDIGATIGEKLLPAATKGATALNRFIGQMSSGKGAGGAFVDTAKRIGDRLLGVGRAAVTVGRRIADLVGWFRRHRTAADALVTVLGAAVAGFAAFKIVTTVISAFKAARLAVLGFNVALTANPVGLVVAAIAALAAGLVIAYRRSDTFRRIVDKTFHVIKTVAGDAIGFILGLFDKYLGGISSIASAMGKLPGPLGKPFRAVAGVIDGAREKIRALKGQVEHLGDAKPKPVRIPVQVAVSRSDRGSPAPGGAGDPWGIAATVNDVAHKEGMRLIADTNLGAMPAPGGAGGGKSATGLVPQVRRALAWAAAHGWRGAVSSGFRSVAEQTRLWNNRASNPYPVAPPGQSRHGTGQAVDVTDVPGFRRAMASAPPDSRLIWFGPGDAVHFSVDGRRFGGRAGPGSGGARAIIYGEGALDEWVISQEGDRGANVRWAREALETLTGRTVELHRGGKGAKKKKHKPKKPPKPVLTAKENRGIRRSVSRGEHGIGSFESDIQGLERDYGQADRRFGLTDEEILVEHDDGSVTVDTAAAINRVNELEGLRTIRRAILARVRAYRRRVLSLMGRLRKAIRDVGAALKAAKGKRRQKERGRYRDQISGYRSRLGELRDVYADLGGDVEDSGIDLAELGDEISTVQGSTGKAAPVEEAKDPTLESSLTEGETGESSAIDLAVAEAGATPDKADDETARGRGESFWRGVIERLKASGASAEVLTAAFGQLSGFLPPDKADEAGGGGTGGTEEARPPSPLEIATAASDELRGFTEGRAALFGSAGSNFAAAGLNPFADPTGQAAGVRYFGATGASDLAAPGARSPMAAGGVVINQRFDAPPPDPHTWAHEARYSLEGMG